MTLLLSPPPELQMKHVVFVEQIYFCSMYAVVVWDWLVSLSDEYRLIWKKQWTPVKCIYVLCRYWPICLVPYTLWVYTTDHEQATCEKIFRTVPLLMTFNMLFAELVLLIRTYAFLGRKSWMLGALLMLLCGMLAYQLYVPIAQMELLPVGAPGESGPCFPVARPHSAHVTGFFVAPLLFDMTVTGLTAHRALELRVRSSLVNTFLREGLGYFVLISLANVANGIMYLQRDAVLQALNVPLSIMVPNVLACRLILALRARGTNVDLHTASVVPQMVANGRMSALGQRTDSTSPLPPHPLTFSTRKRDEEEGLSMSTVEVEEKTVSLVDVPRRPSTALTRMLLPDRERDRGRALTASEGATGQITVHVERIQT